MLSVFKNNDSLVRWFIDKKGETIKLSSKVVRILTRSLFGSWKTKTVFQQGLTTDLNKSESFQGYLMEMWYSVSIIKMEKFFSWFLEHRECT